MKESHAKIAAIVTGAIVRREAKSFRRLRLFYSAVTIAYSISMSPTVFREKGYRFFFFSREEERMHIHVTCADGEAKYWLTPDIELARSHGLSRKQLTEVAKLVKENRDEIERSWRQHFGG
jgi:hypothetical protein